MNNNNNNNNFGNGKNDISKFNDWWFVHFVPGFFIKCVNLKERCCNSHISLESYDQKLKKRKKEEKENKKEKKEWRSFILFVTESK